MAVRPLFVGVRGQCRIALTPAALLDVLHPRVIACIESGAVAGPIFSTCLFLLVADGRRLGRSKTRLTNGVGPDVSACLRRADNGLLPLIPWGTKQ